MMLRLIGLALSGLISFQAAGPPDIELADLVFMAGCWEGRFESRAGPGTIEERYTGPSENIMLGTTRYLRDGRTVSWEFTLIQRDSLGVTLTPYPNGERSDPFRLTGVEPDGAVFENPSHDYPKRIIYRTEPDGTRVARIDGGPDDPDGREWRLHATRCTS